MNSDLDFRFLVVLLLIPLYYGVLYPKFTSWARPLLKTVAPARRHSSSEATSVVRLLLAGISQMLFCLGLIFLTELSLLSLTSHSSPLILVGYGVLLGIGEMALSSFLCHVIIQALTVLAPNKVPAGIQSWLVIARGGWMRQYLKTMQVLPLPLALLLTVLYVAIEETLFRWVLIQYTLPLGAVGAVAISTCLFMLVQVFRLPSWHAALFPVVGACVMGIVHGLLFLAVPDIVPLVVAHCVFFLAAVL
jgi:hypothetical protein